MSVSRSAWSTEVVSISTLLIATSVSYTIAAYDLIDRGPISSLTHSPFPSS